MSTALHKNLLGCLEIVESAKNGQESPNLRNATTFAICRMNRWRPPRDGDVHRQLPSAQQCDPEDQMTESLLISAIQYTILSLTGSFVCRSSRYCSISLSSRVASHPSPLPNIILSEMSTVVRCSFYSQILHCCTFQEDNLVIASVWTCPMSKKELHNTPGY